MKSQARASSQPPPSANPLTAATTGSGSAEMTSITRCPSAPKCRARSASIPFISAMSAPATKAFSPAPVTIIPRTSERSARSPAIFSSSCSVLVSSAFSDFGRSTVTVANGPSTSSRTFTSGMLPSSLLVDVEPAPGLLPQPARVHVLAQERTGAVLRISQPAVHHLRDEEHRVQPDEVRELQRAHRLVGAELHRGIDVLGGAQTLHQGIGRLVEHRDEDPVDDEPRVVAGGHHRLPHRLGEAPGPLEGAVRGR